MDASPLQPAESPSVPNASAPADTRGDGPGPGPGLGPDPTHDGSSSYRHRNSFPLPADGSLGPSASNGDVGAKRRYIDMSYSLNRTATVPSSNVSSSSSSSSTISERSSAAGRKRPRPGGQSQPTARTSMMVENPYMKRPAKNPNAEQEQLLPPEVILKIFEFTPDPSETDLDNYLYVSASLCRSNFEKVLVSGPVQFRENWRDIRDAKKKQEEMLVQETYSKLVSLCSLLSFAQ